MEAVEMSRPVQPIQLDQDTREIIMKRKEYLYCQQIRWWMKKSVREY
jgi:hypothetical protein